MSISLINPSSGGASSGTGGTSDHAALSNLDYPNAAHTGFMPAVTTGALSATTPITITASRQALGGATTVAITTGILTISAPLSTSGQITIPAAAGTIGINTASAASDGYLNSTDWGIFNGKFNTVTTGTVSATTPITVTGSRSILGGTATIAVTTGVLTVSAPLNTASVLSLIGGANTISITTASLASNGYITNTDYGKFDRKTKSFVVYAPPGTATYPIWKTPTAVTISSANVLVTAGATTSLTGQLQEADANGGSGVQITASGAIVAGTNTGLVITNASIDANDYILWVTTATSGQITSLVVSFSYVEA